jgi:co-chaperonin GroES (HSP10)
MIAVPESYKDGSTTCVVLAVGTKSHPFIKVNDRVLVETGFADRKEARIGDTKAFWCEQRHIYALIRNREIFPIGKRILIRRDMADKREHGMIIESHLRYQSLEGWVEKLGITRQHYRYCDLNIGDKICLAGWTERMLAIELTDGAYGLLVDESDLLYKIES